MKRNGAPYPGATDELNARAVGRLALVNRRERGAKTTQHRLIEIVGIMALVGTALWIFTLTLRGQQSDELGPLTESGQQTTAFMHMIEGDPSTLTLARPFGKSQPTASEDR